MKIHIVREGQETIKGFTKVLVKDGVINFNDVSDNQSVFILAGDVLDEFPIEKTQECLKLILQKLRLGGKLVIGGTDIRLFCKSVINSLITKENASNTIFNCKSMTDIETVLLLIRSAGLNVITTQTNGVHYEITAERG
jgi:hypothetical protein